MVKDLFLAFMICFPNSAHVLFGYVNKRNIQVKGSILADIQALIFSMLLVLDTGTSQTARH